MKRGRKPNAAVAAADAGAMAEVVAGAAEEAVGAGETAATVEIEAIAGIAGKP